MTVPLMDYSAPRRECDIVMKGGITSGIVYPLAVCALAQTYRFVSVGGTSAGAIAAAATAAAEYGRTHGGAGFPALAQLPTELGSNGTLLSLFQPSPTGRRAFAVLVASLGAKRGRLWRIVGAILGRYPIEIVAGLLPGVLLLLLIARDIGAPPWWAYVSALSIAVLGVTSVLLLRGIVPLLRDIPRNAFGLCTGMSPHGAARPALAPWLDGRLNRLAGITDPNRPLTFGDLWGTADESASRSINLEMETTCLSHGRPYRMPFKEHLFFFDPAELRRFFPATIVNWMETHARPDDHATDYKPLVALPLAADLPVVVAARMSLSFPLLISAIPLYAVDYSRIVPEGQLRKPERVWFSDGGICSNFPVHFFDAPLPRRPTFAINLRPYHPDHPPDGDESHAVWMPESNSGGIVAWWTRFDAKPSIAAFVDAILNAMQNWHDNVQLAVPGYRDRVVHVSLDAASEGGLNLNMPPAVIDAVSRRGFYAGMLARNRFADPPGGGGWANQRWVRYRTTMAIMQRTLASLADVYLNPADGDPAYRELTLRDKETPPDSYRWEPQSVGQTAESATAALAALPAEWEVRQLDFTRGAPSPSPELQIVPST